MSRADAAPGTDAAPEAPARRTSTGRRALWTGIGAIIVFGLAGLVQYLTDAVPALAAGTWFGDIAESIEYPIYAIALGFLANAVLSLCGIRDRMEAAFRTELFIKIGLVLLGATINFAIFVKAFGPAVIQAVCLIAIVFAFTWWFAGVLGLDDRLRALLASALSICGVSAAVAAAGAVRAKKEQLAYTATLVIVFAVPSIFLLPCLAGLLGLPPAVTGAWIGGNIDTTAAVTAAGTVAGEQPLQIASIVKVTQNALLGFVAVLLTLYFTLRVDRRAGAGEAPASGAAADAGAPRPRAWAMVWDRFPKFVLGFLFASIIATVLGATMDPAVLEPRLDAAKELQVWALSLAFVSIGLEFTVSSVREAGWKPILVFTAATLVNLVAGLGLALLLFSSFEF